MPNLVMSEQLKIAIDAVQSGKMVVMVDDETRENEGDLVMAAEFITPEAINFMITHARGLVCLPMTRQRVDYFRLPMMTQHNQSRYSTAFTVSIEAKDGITTGISAFDRARTIKLITDSSTSPLDIVSPGHVFPLVAADDGVLQRKGHTEGSVDLLRLAGLTPVAVICEILKDDGTMARLFDLKAFAGRHHLPIITIAELVKWRSYQEGLPKGKVDQIIMTSVDFQADAAFPSAYGGVDMHIQAFRARDNIDHLAVIKGSPGESEQIPLVRLHSECVTGDVLGSLRCDCGLQLQAALQQISASGCGILLYLRGHEGRGIGLGNKIRAYALQDNGLDTVEANEKLGFPVDLRDWSVAASILYKLGVQTIDLLTNNAEKTQSMERYGIKVRRQVGLETKVNPYNQFYLKTKQLRMGHSLSATTVR